MSEFDAMRRPSTRGLFPLWRVIYRRTDGAFAQAYFVAPERGMGNKHHREPHHSPFMLAINAVAQLGVSRRYTMIDKELVSEHPIMRGDERLTRNGWIVGAEADRETVEPTLMRTVA